MILGILGLMALQVFVLVAIARQLGRVAAAAEALHGQAQALATRSEAIVRSTIAHYHDEEDV